MPFMPRSTRPAVVLALALALAAPAQAEVYRLDPVHTRVAFVVDHAGLSRAIGTFAGVQGRLDFDPAHWDAAKVELTVPLATLDLGSDDWREAILDGTFLDAGDHPLAHFVSTAVEPTATDHARVTGTLTLRGVARPVVLDVQLNAVKRHPITRRRSAGFSATATLSRREFGMNEWANVVGDAVELRIEAEAILDPRAAAPAAAPGAAPTAAAPAATSAPPPSPAETAPEPTDDAADPQH